MEWVSIDIEYNKFLLNQIYKPNFIKLNEPDKRKEDNIPLHKEYNLIDNGLFIGLIFKAKYNVQEIY